MDLLNFIKFRYYFVLTRKDHRDYGKEPIVLFETGNTNNLENSPNALSFPCVLLCAAIANIKS